MKTLKLTATVIGCALAFAVLPASATTIYNLSLGNSGLNNATADYAEVDVSLSGGVATITFTAHGTYRFNGESIVSVNVNGPFTVGTYPGTMTVEAPPGAPQVDGWGNFNFVLDNPAAGGVGGYGDALTSVTFTLNGTWLSDAAVLVNNADGYLASAHIYTAGGLTGYAAEGGRSIPDGGSTVALLGLAMLGLGSIRRMFKS